MGWDVMSLLRFGNAVGWSLFVVGHFEFANGPGREENLWAAMKLASIGVISGLLPLNLPWSCAAMILVPLFTHKRINVGAPSTPIASVQEFLVKSKAELLKESETNDELRLDIERVQARIDRLGFILKGIHDRFPGEYADADSLLIKPLLSMGALRLNYFLGSAAGSRLNAFVSMVQDPRTGVVAQDIALRLDGLRRRPIDWSRSLHHIYLAGYPIIVEEGDLLPREDRERLENAAVLLRDISDQRRRSQYDDALRFIESIVISDLPDAMSGSFGHPLINVHDNNDETIAASLLHEGYHHFARSKYYSARKGLAEASLLVSLPEWSDHSLPPGIVLEELGSYAVDFRFMLDYWELEGFYPRQDNNIILTMLHGLSTAHVAMGALEKFRVEGKFDDERLETLQKLHQLWDDLAKEIVPRAISVAAVYSYADEKDNRELKELIQFAQGNYPIGKKRWKPLEKPEVAQRFVDVARAIREGRLADVLILLPEDPISSAPVFGNEWHSWVTEQGFQQMIISGIETAGLTNALTNEQWLIFESVLQAYGMDQLKIDHMRSRIETPKAQIVPLTSAKPLDLVALSAALLRLDETADKLPVILVVYESQKEYYEKVVQALKAAGFRRELRLSIAVFGTMNDHIVMPFALINQLGLNPQDVQFVLGRDIQFKKERLLPGQTEILSQLATNAIFLESLLPVENLQLRDFAIRLRAVLVGA
jgi:hypothetical protein